VKWTQEQREAVSEELRHLISIKRVPRQDDCEQERIRNCPVLQNMSWRRIKDQASSQIQSLRRHECTARI